MCDLALLAHRMGSHMPSSEDLFLFLEGGCCYVRSFLIAEDSLHVTTQPITFECSLDVFAGVYVL